MNIEDYYLVLTKHYHQHQIGISIAVTIDKLTEILDCTKRNTQLILNKLTELKLIQWQPGRGRGNSSHITFLQSINQFVLDRAKKFSLDGKLEEAWKLIEEYQIQQIKYEFTEWLYHQLGFKQLDNEEEVLRFPFYRPIPDIDPTFVHRRTEAHWVKQIFNTLVSFDQKTKKVTPELAHFWENSDDYKTWRFFIKKGIQFHHGKELTSEDIAYTFERIKDKANFEFIRMTLKEIHILGKYAIEFNLHEPDVLFAHYLCSEKCSIVPADHPNIPSFERLPIGTGPFKIKENSDSKLTLVAHDRYFEGRPHLDRIEMWVWPNYEENRMIHHPRDNDIYFGEFAVVKDVHNKINSLEKGSTYLTFNLQKESSLQDKTLRTAIDLAINREQLIKELHINGLPASSFFPNISQKNYRNESNLDRAKQLVKESRYQGETFHLYTYEMTSNERNANWLKQAISKIGITIEVIVLPIKQLSNHETLNQADLIVAGEVLGVQEDLSIIEMFMYSDGFILNHLATDQKLTLQTYLKKCKHEKNIENRLQYLQELEQHLKQHYSYLYLYHIQQTIMHSHSLQGIIMNPWGKVDYKNVWLKRTGTDPQCVNMVK